MINIFKNYLRILLMGLFLLTTITIYPQSGNNEDLITVYMGDIHSTSNSIQSDYTEVSSGYRYDKSPPEAGSFDQYPPSKVRQEDTSIYISEHLSGYGLKHLHTYIWNVGREKLAYTVRMIYKPEDSFNDKTWVRANGPQYSINEIEPRGTQYICYIIDTSLLNLGKQTAYIAIYTNDPNNPIIEIPLTVFNGPADNQPPCFKDAPTEINIVEGETAEVLFEAVDPNRDDVVIDVMQLDEKFSHTIDGNKLILNLAPQAGDAGSYVAKFKVTDIYGVSSEISVDINVVRANRPPFYIGDFAELNYIVSDPAVEFNINDLFVDRDGDTLTFTIESLDTNVLAADKISETTFTLKPIGIGSTQIHFVVTDSQGATINHTIDIFVKAIEKENRPPVYIGDFTELNYSISDPAVEFNINDLFADPDGDVLTFTIESANPNILAADKISETIFRLKPNSAGNTQIHFVVTDSQGAALNHTIDIFVKAIEKENRPPVYIGDFTELNYIVSDPAVEFNINDLFSDPDGDVLTFTIESANTKILAADKISETTFRLKPMGVGNTQIHFVVTDSQGAAINHTINIEVARVNHPPVYIGKTSKFTYLYSDPSVSFNINDLFSDPDGDPLSFTVESADESIVDAYHTAGDLFELKPIGGGITKIKFVVTDSYGASIVHYWDVEVKSCLHVVGLVIQRWNNMLLVSNVGSIYKIDGYQWYKNGLPIKDANKQYYSAGNLDTDMLDFNAEYHVRLITVSGDVIYTCPMKPVKQNISLKVYPVPVSSGGTLRVEADLPDLNSTPIVIRVISLSGHTYSTVSSREAITSVQMPSGSGTYLVKITNGMVEKTFNVIVE